MIFDEDEIDARRTVRIPLWVLMNCYHHCYEIDELREELYKAVRGEIEEMEELLLK